MVVVQQEAGDDTTSASGQAGATAPSTPLLVSPRSGDSDQRASAMQAHADKSAGLGTPRRHSYDGGGDGGGAMSGSFTSSGVSSASPEPVSLALGTAAPGSPSVAVKAESIYSVPSLISLPSLPAGLVGDENGVDSWWT